MTLLELTVVSMFVFAFGVGLGIGFNVLNRNYGVVMLAVVSVAFAIAVILLPPSILGHQSSTTGLIVPFGIIWMMGIGVSGWLIASVIRWALDKGK